MLSRTNVILAALSSIALGGASSGRYPPTATYMVPLSGVAESNVAHPAGGTGDLNASGLVKLAIDPGKKQICYNFQLTGVSTPLMAHIHEGPALKNGPPVVTLFTGPSADLNGCVTWLHGQLAEIVANPSGFYVDLDTTEFPDGALRGQISG